MSGSNTDAALAAAGEGSFPRISGVSCVAFGSTGVRGDLMTMSLREAVFIAAVSTVGSTGVGVLLAGLVMLTAG